MPIPGTWDDPKKHPPHASLYPIISNIAWNVNGTTVTITWTTDVASTSQVAYGTNQNKDLRSPYDSTMVTSHSVTLSGLNVLIPYYFNVQSFYFDSLSISQQYSFTTGAAFPLFIRLEDGTYMLLEDGSKVLTEQ